MKLIKTISQCISPAIFFTTVFLIGCKDVNSNHHNGFDDDGFEITDTTVTKFELATPNSVKFYVEVSGSMNGFFRPNVSTQFKKDFWDILSYYSNKSSKVSVLTDSGTKGEQYDLHNFQTQMNTGSFISCASTKVPVMLETIMNDFDVDAGEVAVLVSDMKYSPVGAAAPDVLMSQYNTDIKKIFLDFNKSASLICATSDYVGQHHNTISSKSPYYYLILGKQEYVAKVRNDISSILDKTSGLEPNTRFVDNIESGFDYGQPDYRFGKYNKCNQLEEEPTFTEYEEAEDGDTCTIQLKINLEKYRWLLCKKHDFELCFKVKAIYGSQVKVDNVEMKEENITDENHELKREAEASLDLKIYDMATDSEVIEWDLDIPNNDYTLMNEYFEGANDENDPFKSYSVLNFIHGMIEGGKIGERNKPHFILISKN